MSVSATYENHFMYSAVEKRYYSREIGIYESNDIIVKCNSVVICHLHDISCDKQWILKFVKKLNENDVMPIHLKDLIVDFLP